MQAPPTKTTVYQPTPAVVKRHSTKAAASFTTATGLNGAQAGTGAPTVAIIKKNSV